MNREQFLLDRKKGIGGSDVASILGVSPFRTSLDVYHDKTSPELVYEEMNEDLQRGMRVEKSSRETPCRISLSHHRTCAVAYGGFRFVLNKRVENGKELKLLKPFKTKSLVHRVR